MQEIKERPIIFQTPMVEAILDECKTKTRRLNGLGEINKNPDDWQVNWFDYKVGWCFNQKSSINEQSIKDRSFNQVVVKCPFGLVGDLLWVREKFFYGEAFDYENEEVVGEQYIFYAGHPVFVDGTNRDDFKWKPSIHMPKIAARIWLELTDVQVERLQDITDKDAIAEGIMSKKWDGTEGFIDYLNPDKEDKVYIFSYGSFKSLWHSINGIDSWNLNPFVWVLTFKVLSTTGRPSLPTANCQLSTGKEAVNG